MRRFFVLAVFVLSLATVLVFHSSSPVELAVAFPARCQSESTLSALALFSSHLPHCERESRLTTTVDSEGVRKLSGISGVTKPCLMECEPDSPNHVAVAEKLVAHLGKSKLNKYYDGCGGFQKIRWDGDDCAEAFVDSAAFVTLLLYNADGWKGGDFEATFGTVNPNAEQYFKAINFQDRGWAVVGANSLTKGDFIVVSCKRPQERNSGHIMMVDEDPSPAGKGGVAAPSGTKAFDVIVIDSALKPHGKADTRAVNPGKFGPNGVGRGKIRVFVDASNCKKVYGYTWSTDDSSEPILKDSVLFGRAIL